MLFRANSVEINWYLEHLPAKNGNLSHCFKTSRLRIGQFEQFTWRKGQHFPDFECHLPKQKGQYLHVFGSQSSVNWKAEKHFVKNRQDFLLFSTQHAAEAQRDALSSHVRPFPFSSRRREAACFSDYKWFRINRSCSWEGDMLPVSLAIVLRVSQLSCFVKDRAKCCPFFWLKVFGGKRFFLCVPDRAKCCPFFWLNVLEAIDLSLVFHTGPNAEHFLTNILKSTMVFRLSGQSRTISAIFFANKIHKAFYLELEQELESLIVNIIMYQSRACIIYKMSFCILTLPLHLWKNDLYTQDIVISLNRTLFCNSLMFQQDLILKHYFSSKSAVVFATFNVDT